MPEFFTTTAGVLTLIAGALLALGVIWAKAIRPVVQFASRGVSMVEGMNKLLPMVPMLQEVVEQVRNDNGSSMKDTLGIIHDQATQAKGAAEVAATKVEKVARKLAAVSKIQTEHRAYVHEKFHAIENSLAVIQGAAMVSVRQHERKKGEERRAPAKKRKARGGTP